MSYKQKYLKINLQFFAESDPPGEKNPTQSQTKTYSEEEYLKLKKSFDQASSELADAKKQIKNQMSDEEKKKQEQKELTDKIASYESQLENISIEKELLKGGFTSEEIEKVIKEKGNNVSLATTIANIVKAKLEQAKKEWQQELIDKTKGVSGSSNNGDGEESIAIKKAKQSKKQEPPVSWGNYK